MSSQEANHWQAHCVRGPNPSDLDVYVRDEALVLTTARALFWPRTRTLLIADVHLGKAHTLRAHGISVPTGDTAADLAILVSLIQRFEAQRLLVLGDLVHSPVLGGEPWLAQWHEFTEKLAAIQCSISVVRGNHDRQISALGSAIEWIPDVLAEAPFLFCHDLTTLSPNHRNHHYPMAGHVHPVVRYRLPASTLRLPAYHFASDGALLPAYGAATGGFVIQPKPGDQTYVIADRVVAVRLSSFRALPR